MSIDTHTQVRKKILDEIQDWLRDYNVEDMTYETVNDLATGIYEELLEGGALDPALPETNEDEDEHYN